MIGKNSKKRRRKKKSRYQRGIHASPIAGECKFRSGWEQKYMIFLDAHADVASWSYEKLIIEYISNKSTGKIRKYYPDFYVELKNGTKFVVEIKQKRKLDSANVKKKSEAAKLWCHHHGMTFLMLTEIELKQLGVI